MDHTKPFFNRNNPATLKSGPFTPDIPEFCPPPADLPSTHIEVINAEFGIRVEMALDDASMEGTLREDIKKQIYSTANRIWTSHRAGTHAEVKTLKERLEAMVEEAVMPFDPRNRSLHSGIEDLLKKAADGFGPSPS